MGAILPLDAPRGAHARPDRSGTYPWYDSVWLAQFARALEIIAAVRPAALTDFGDAMSVFRTRGDFTPQRIASAFDAATLAEIRRIVASLAPTDLELHEARTFRRYVVHDHPYFTRLQAEAAGLVSAAAGEPVEPSYNFLSLYASGGVCPPHLDAPFAKWTLDLCLEQQGDWPIHFSRVHDWEEVMAPALYAPGWQERLKESPGERFETMRIHPGEAVVFSGSSQWHYRDPMPSSCAAHGVTLLFLHYIPRGTAQLVRPENWAALFGIPELSQVGTTDGGFEPPQA